MKRLFAVAVAVTVALPAWAADGPSTASATFQLTLDAAGVHEECATLTKGEQRRYYWKADGPLEFNIHFHAVDNRVSYALKREGLRTDGGTFTAKVAQEYCWMWSARDRPVRLEGRIGP